jgi:hypothetical protein
MDQVSGVTNNLKMTIWMTTQSTADSLPSARP